MTLRVIRPLAALMATAIIGGIVGTASMATAATPAKKLFGAKRSGAALAPAVYGYYSKGCVAGAEKLPDNGATWQAMRLERNRHWGHPDLISLVKKLSRDGRKVGWNGLLVGDLTQPRGGPMLTGHASHQAGLDADIWLTQMPNRRLTRKERRDTSAISMLGRKANGRLSHQKLDKRRFTRAHAGIIRTAAKYRSVERIFVHPAIKRELCKQYPSQPKWLAKVRAQRGHHYHFHIRMGCPKGSPGCKSQKAVPSVGCDKASMDYWFNVVYGPPRKPKPGTKPKKRKPKPQIVLADLPSQCRVVLSARSNGGQAVAKKAGDPVAAIIKKTKPVTAVTILRPTVPTRRPAN